MIWKSISFVWALTVAAEDCDRLINVVTGEVKSKISLVEISEALWV